MYDAHRQNRGNVHSPSFPSQHRGVGREVHDGEPDLPGQYIDSHRTTNLCQRCRKAMSQHDDLDLLESGENSESATQAAAAALTQLAETLSSGISSEQRGIACLVSLIPEYPASLVILSFRAFSNRYNWIERRTARSR
jgi:hypothetical protein